ncbi:MAG: cyclic lactone autoinducer peptide [Clostridiales bacterium]|nr:cyclic lactone autoinducer peptide [Clostridiales bacterium]
MKDVSKTVLKVTERMARKEAASSSEAFPPVCAGILHQPKRPQQKDK